MKTLHLVLLAAGLSAGTLADPGERLADAPEPKPFRPWPSTPPADCPFPKSDSLVGMGFTGRHAEYTQADTWYPSWAVDGNLYSPWTDGSVNGLGCNSAGENAATGHATILGDDPLRLSVTNQGTFPSSPRPYEGRYPCGSLVYNGVWYYGTYCLHPSGKVPRDGIPYNWPWLGPFVGFRWSTNFGRTWAQTPCTPEKPLFGERALQGEPVRIGAPHFVDFGRNMEHSPDGKAYLVAQGASDGKDRRFAYNSWITADQVYLIRVTPGIENMNDASKYEYFAGRDDQGAAIWTRDFAQIKPIAEWRDHMGCVTMTYNAPLRKFLLCVTDGGNTVSRFHTYVLESGRITGPWRLVAYLSNFGEQAYFVNVPSKFIGKDGRSLWLCYAANFSSGWGGITFKSLPPGSRYGMCLQEVRLLAPTDPIATDASDSPADTAPDASARAAPQLPAERPLALRKLMDTPLRDTSICRGPDGAWYLTGTVEPFWGFNEGIKLWKSPDLTNWTALGFVWKYGASPWHKKFLEAKKPLWAPEVHYLKGTFWLTYSMPGWDGTAKTSGSGLLKSMTGKPEGPYADVQPAERMGDEIDASLFEDDDGAVYFLWHSGKIARLKPDMSGLAEAYRWLKTTTSDPNPKHHSDLCAKIFGKGSFDHVGYEGMFLFKRGGRYYLCCAENFEGRYSCAIATATNLFGPYDERYEAIPHGGHNMFFKDARGHWWSTYFGSDPTAPWQERPGVLPIEFDADGRVSPQNR